MQPDDPTDSFVGQWWVPGEERAAMFGRLDISEQADLELFESVEAESRRRREVRLDAPILHGRSMGTSLTLLDNVETGLSTRIRGKHAETCRKIVPGTVLVGGHHIQTVDECRFDRASLRITNLDQWVNRTPYRWSNLPLDSVELVDLPILQASIPGGELYLRRSTESLHGALTDSGFRSHEVLELHLNERHALDELEYRFVRPLTQLLSLATGANCRHLDMTVGMQDTAGSDERSGWPYDSFEVRRSRSDVIGAGVLSIRQRMRFGMNCADYPPDVDFGDIVSRWFGVQEHLSSVCDFIFSLRSETPGYLQQQMFTIASAIEGLHRGLNPQLEEKTGEDRTRNKEILAAIKDQCPDHHQWLADVIRFAHRRPYVFRVRELLDITDHLMAEIVGDEEAWTQKLREIRDGIGHVLQSQDSNAFQQMVAMLQSAQLLAEIVLLRQLGFTDAECRQSLEHHWERQNVRAHVERSFPEWFSARSSSNL